MPHFITASIVAGCLLVVSSDTDCGFIVRGLLYAALQGVKAMVG